MTAAFVFPGQGSQAVGMGKALAEAFAPARAVFDEVDAALGEKLTATMWDGPADKLTLTENAQPALMAVSLAAMRVLEAEAGVDLEARRAIRRRPFARRVFGAGGGRRASPSPTPRGFCASAAAPCSRRFRSAPARWRPCSGWSLRTRHGGRRRSRAGRGVPGRQRQRRRAGGGVRQQVGGRARGRDRQGQGRQARDDAAGVRAVPLRADAARGRRDGGGAGEDQRQAAGRAGGRQRAGEADQRSAGDRAPPGRAGHRHRALARMRGVHGGRTASRHSTRSAPARC